MRQGTLKAFPDPGHILFDTGSPIRERRSSCTLALSPMAREMKNGAARTRSCGYLTGSLACGW
jgi:hypothetical protein